MQADGRLAPGRGGGTPLNASSHDLGSLPSQGSHLSSLPYQGVALGQDELPLDHLPSQSKGMVGILPLAAQ